MKIMLEIDKDFRLDVLMYYLDRFKKNYKAGDVLTGNLSKFKDKRSLAQLHTYWTIMKWCSDNIPDWMEKYFKKIGIKHISYRTMDAMCKEHAEIDSISFDNMDHVDMTDYMNETVHWIAKLWSLNPKTLVDDILRETHGVRYKKKIKE